MNPFKAGMPTEVSPTDVKREEYGFMLASVSERGEFAASDAYIQSRMRNEAITKKTTPGNGAVILHARDAKVHGKKLRYEPEPHKDTLGFWVDKSDWAEWQFTIPGKGRFDVELLAGCGKGSGGSTVEVQMGGADARKGKG